MDKFLRFLTDIVGLMIFINMNHNCSYFQTSELKRELNQDWPTQPEKVEYTKQLWKVQGYLYALFLTYIWACPFMSTINQALSTLDCFQEMQLSVLRNKYFIAVRLACKNFKQHSIGFIITMYGLNVRTVVYLKSFVTLFVFLLIQLNYFPF